MANGWTLIYTDFADYGWLYGAFSWRRPSFFTMPKFYWTHRLMHHPRLFDRFHRLHHESHSPSPWAAYAFAPLEAVIQAMFLTILIFVLPLHVTVIYLFMLHMIVRNVVGHSGFELFPRGMPGHAVFGVLTTNTHHDLHHSSRGSNYGLYFTWWDRLAGTEHPNYREAFDRVTRRQGEPAAPPLSAPVIWSPAATGCRRRQLRDADQGPAWTADLRDAREIENLEAMIGAPTDTLADATQTRAAG